MKRHLKNFLPVIIALTLTLIFGTAEAVGGYLSNYEEVQPQPTAVSWWSTLAYLLSLVAIFAVVIVLAYFTAKFIGGRFNARMTTGGGRILENLPLAPNRSVCIVEIAGRVFLLGVGENISLLAEITDDNTVENLREKNKDMFNQEFGSFSDLIQKIPPIFKKK
ncbi:MAG: flagellar biosynthetic protein FliO [Selenomonadaceae bacterium]|nr:flagellar biosynthetic protein FliO [Selenomonadaceae bacterium]